MDPAKVAGIAGANRVAEFQGARSNHEVRQRKIDAVGGLLATDAGDDLGGGFG